MLIEKYHNFFIIKPICFSKIRKLGKHSKEKLCYSQHAVVVNLVSGVSVRVCCTAWLHAWGKVGMCSHCKATVKLYKGSTGECAGNTSGSLHPWFSIMVLIIAYRNLLLLPNVPDPRYTTQGKKLEPRRLIFISVYATHRQHSSFHSKLGEGQKKSAWFKATQLVQLTINHRTPSSHIFLSSPSALLLLSVGHLLPIFHFIFAFLPRAQTSTESSKPTIPRRRPVAHGGASCRVSTWFARSFHCFYGDWENSVNGIPTTNMTVTKQRESEDNGRKWRKIPEPV